MKIQPNNINSPVQARALQFAQRIMQGIDNVATTLHEADQGENDYNKTLDKVVVSDLNLPKNGSVYLPAPRVTEATLNSSSGRCSLKGEVELPGLSGSINVQISKTENERSIEYVRTFKGHVVGPNTTRVTLDKETEEVVVGRYYLGIIPARLNI